MSKQSEQSENSQPSKPLQKLLSWLFKRQREEVIIIIASCLALSLFIFLWVLSCTVDDFWGKAAGSNGFWTLFALILSAPIAFCIWHFRDQNTIKQLESQRKDVNLKEFHKIAEWVSGLHLVEEEITEKTKQTGQQPNIENPTSESTQSISNTALEELETARKYGQAGNQRHLPSHSREDGAVGLQVAAVYMLKPFFCGEHGDDFRRPALNLLTAAWLALFKQVEEQENLKTDPSAPLLEDNLKKLRGLRKSSLAIALTEVLLAEGGKHLHLHPEVFPNLYLPYVDLDLLGLDTEKVKQLFYKKNCIGIQLQGAFLKKVNLQKTDLQKANFKGAYLEEAHLEGAKLQMANLEDANLEGTHLEGANLQGAILKSIFSRSAHFQGAILNYVRLQKAHLHNADLRDAQLQGAQLQGAQLPIAQLQGANLKNANLQKTQLQGADLEGANLQAADLVNADILETLHLDQVVSWTGTLLKQHDAIYIQKKFNLPNTDWILTPDDINISSEEWPVYFKFQKQRPVDSFTHSLNIAKESQSELLKQFQELNPDWNIEIIQINDSLKI
ncbi:pentapeptide repeat-containing protein [Neisseria montereyensis]|uniref:Pentapeptide repeat-containing protein n=1 Tax=Neisseria montereyensis TaxID=2973938 RepID=A0ABT2FDM4_9NEIS|nr:pentapeptide repeat-containing protein [Neisseria montereyensis]MCS4533849.1 pentapeptide repeat-containing protein [Neisseria montereyensis]